MPNAGSRQIDSSYPASLAGALISGNLTCLSPIERTVACTESMSRWPGVQAVITCDSVVPVYERDPHDYLWMNGEAKITRCLQPQHRLYKFKSKLAKSPSHRSNPALSDFEPFEMRIPSGTCNRSEASMLKTQVQTRLDELMHAGVPESGIFTRSGRQAMRGCSWLLHVCRASNLPLFLFDESTSECFHAQTMLSLFSPAIVHSSVFAPP